MGTPMHISGAVPSSPPSPRAPCGVGCFEPVRLAASWEPTVSGDHQIRLRLGAPHSLDDETSMVATRLDVEQVLLWPRMRKIAGILVCGTIVVHALLRALSYHTQIACSRAMGFSARPGNISSAVPTPTSYIAAVSRIFRSRFECPSITQQ
jgi:hypothetical protein